LLSTKCTAAAEAANALWNVYSSSKRPSGIKKKEEEEDI
jgi:hypothetical protein